MKRILVFGDSHSVYFYASPEMRQACIPLQSEDEIAVKVRIIQGASILGFGRRESKLNSHEIFVEDLEVFKPTHVIFALGQVDIELGYYYRTIVKKEQLTIEDFIDRLNDTYFATVEALGLGKDVKVSIKGVNQTCLTMYRNKAINYTSRIITENIQSEEERKQYQRDLYLSFPSALERTTYHNKFNNALRQQSHAKGYLYFDINSGIVDEATGFVKDTFSPASIDHHLVDSIHIRKLHWIAFFQAERHFEDVSV